MILVNTGNRFVGESSPGITSWALDVKWNGHSDIAGTLEIKVPDRAFWSVYINPTCCFRGIPTQGLKKLLHVVFPRHFCLFSVP